MTLVGDIGGTNTTIALVERSDGRFVLRARERFNTARLQNAEEAISRFRTGHQAAFERVDRCCLSAAGPVKERVCRMTNVPFRIDGAKIEEATGVRTFIINDFSAICYALPLLESHPSIESVALPHTDGTVPKPHGAVRAVVGAGTGLGTGYLIEDRGHFTAHPSEGGHSDFAAEDDITREFDRYLRNRLASGTVSPDTGTTDSGREPDAESYVSGQGIANAFGFFVDTGRLERDATVARIADGDPRDIPEAVSRNAATHTGLGRIMDLFVTLYARYARNTALFFLPRGGLYLAGGIAAKNERWFTDEHRFMRTFEKHTNDKIAPLLMDVPVFLVKDYDISLYGAAHAAHSLM